MKYWRCLSACAVFALLVQSAGAYNIVNVPIMRGTPLIDGRISPEEMKHAAVTSMTLVGSIDRPKRPTTVVMLVGQNAFYAGFICDDDQTSGLITKVKKENGPVFEYDDAVQLVIAPAKDVTQTNYYHFAVNALGVRYSRSMTTDAPVVRWQAAAQRTATGWQVEMLIPLDEIGASLDIPYWRANASRFRPSRGNERAETSAWVDPGSTLHNYKRFGYLKLINLPFPQLAEVFGQQAVLPQGNVRRSSATTASAASLTAPANVASAARLTTSSGSLTSGTTGSLLQTPVQGGSTPAVSGGVSTVPRGN